MYDKEYENLDDFEKENGFFWQDIVNNNISRINCTFGGYADFVQPEPRMFKDKDKNECLLKMESIGDNILGIMVFYLC